MKLSNQLKKSLTGILFLSAFSSLAWAKSGGTRIGVVNMQTVLVSVPEGKKAQEKLKKEIKLKEAELAKQQKELDEWQKKLKSELAMLSEKAKLQKQQEFQEKFMALRQANMTFQAEIKKKEGEAAQRIALKAAKIANTLAEKENLDVVFEASSAGILYVKSPVDLTNRVISEYGKKKVAKSGSPSKLK